MIYEEFSQSLEQYNWDNGFDFPRQVIAHSTCDLAMALKVFYLADGYGYFQKPVCKFDNTTEWYMFIDTLYHAICNGQYPRTEHHYKIPLSKIQIYKLSRNHVPLVFLTDL